MTIYLAGESINSSEEEFEGYASQYHGKTEYTYYVTEKDTFIRICANNPEDAIGFLEEYLEGEYNNEIFFDMAQFAEVKNFRHT